MDARRVTREGTPTIDGIPCTIQAPRVLAAIRDVCASIQRSPRDWRRLRHRVRRIEWLAQDDADCAIAQFLPDDVPDDADVETALFRSAGACASRGAGVAAPTCCAASSPMSSATR
jgi:hypothetical protein